MASIDWDRAVRVGTRLAGSYPLEGTYHESRFARQAPDLVARAAGLVEAETGLCGPGEPDVAVVGRGEWVENNVASFGALLAPAQERLAKQRSVGAGIARRVVGAEIGAVLGLLARRVLGQYELVLPKADGAAGDTVMFVGSNVLAMERRHEFRPDEFRFWVALHECTHRAQFTGVPWLRDYFLGLVGDLVTASSPEPGRLARVASELRAASTSGEPLVKETGLFGLFASPPQREAIEKVQALMSLLEGHGHVVMDRIGARTLVTQQRMSEVLKMRRQDPRAAMFMRLVGLEMKLRQYEMGAEFIAGVERHAGWETLDRAWEGPERLPTLEEISNPVLWLERVG
ncbi:MAG: zinc-dependent metalloprotease [Acidimicrobiia bacterium]